MTEDPLLGTERSLVIVSLLEEKESPVAGDQPETVWFGIQHDSARDLREGQGIPPCDVRMPPVIEGQREPRRRPLRPLGV